MASLFTRIIQGEIPCHKISENEYCYSFLDIRPLAKGHTLVIPKQEIDYIFDVPDELLQEMILFSKKLAIAIKTVVPCIKVGMSVIGLEVPHAHIHLVPLNQISELNFSNPRLHFSDQEYTEIALKISQAYEALK
ncbi:MAG: HIT family protein [Saprospiraceae bacterium]|nr:HIT family protein [Saprospiraceae bacterium]